MTKLEFTNVEVYARHGLQVGWTKINAKQVLVALIETPTKAVVQVFYKAGRMRKWHALNWGCQVVVAAGSVGMELPETLVPMGERTYRAKHSMVSNEWLNDLMAELNDHDGAEILWRGECNDVLGHCQIKLQGAA